MKTVPDAGWAALTNGELLGRAQHEFDAFVTVDRNLPFQQDLSRFSIAVIALRAPSNRVADLRELIPQLLAALPVAKRGEVFARRSARAFGSGAEARIRWTGWTKLIVFGKVSWVSPPVSSEPKGSTYLNALMRPHNPGPPWSGRRQQPSCLFQQARLKRLRRQA